METRTAKRLAICATFGTAILLMWVIGAVGLIGAEGNPADRMYAGVIAIAAVGAAVTRLRPGRMARVLVATAFAQALVAAIALIRGEHHAAVTSIPEIVLSNGFFVALWLGAAWLFRSATRERRAVAAGLPS